MKTKVKLFLFMNCASFQRLSELCDKKRKCTIYVDTTTFEDDPCPTTSKYLQMSYKCRPVLFDGESFCEGAEMQLECREGRRLAIYSANYGRSARTQAAHCTAPVHFTKGEKIFKIQSHTNKFLVVAYVSLLTKVGIYTQFMKRMSFKKHTKVEYYKNLLRFC
uniref:SUEL-type lectin domain-containing protein n=1 Tax=Angiostrongylus cantonensis TaxID=6313 RepID=A0A0K0CX18_ANGCA